MELGIRGKMHSRIQSKSSHSQEEYLIKLVSLEYELKGVCDQ